jgi:hypothetical protein
MTAAARLRNDFDADRLRAGKVVVLGETTPSLDLLQRNVFLDLFVQRT